MSDKSLSLLSTPSLVSYIPGAWSEFSSDVMHMGFIYSRPEPSALISQDPARPIPILIRAEIVDGSLPVDLARQRLSDSVRSFLGSVSLASLTQPYRRSS
jgi:hypothetical protein